LREGKLADARQHFEAALALYRRIDNSYSIGRAHQRLARLESGAEREQHLSAAREVWHRLGRTDLVADLEKEFTRPRSDLDQEDPD
jgi:hypothetical protein